jgi:sortase (surface protein transpeptidase)
MQTKTQILTNKSLWLVLVAIAFLVAAFLWKQPQQDPVDNQPAVAAAATLKIPNINAEAPVIFPTDMSEENLNRSLASGVIRYPESATPGEFGNVYIYGLSGGKDTKGKFGSVFKDLPKLKRGDKINIIYNNLRYEYEIIDFAPASDTINNPSGRKLLTLETPDLKKGEGAKFIVLAELFTDPVLER